MKLSILICSVQKRLHKFAQLAEHLEKQAQNKPVEILWLGDNKSMTVGEKRNKLLSLAKGQYVCFVDDDDWVADDYIDELLKGTESGADVICFNALYRNLATCEEQPVSFDMGNLNVNEKLTLSICIDTPLFNGASIQACIFNARCFPVNGKMKLVIDTAIHISSIVADSAAIISGDTLIWNFDSLSDLKNVGCVSMKGTVDSLHAPDSVFVTLLATPIAGDSIPSNNNITYWVKPFPNNCVGLPFDPNEKSVYPAGDISSTQKLTYTIHFQNTGTAAARDVAVIDSLSPYLDPTTLDVISSSSPVSVAMSSGNVVQFTFSNINLPDTAASKTASVGVVEYTIIPKTSVVVGDIIKNKAGIYFDSNPEIVTNTTMNKISSAVAGLQEIQKPMNIACFPNPFTTVTTIVFNTNGKHYLELTDLAGRTIRSIQCRGNQYELSREGLASGVYFIKAYDEGQKYMAVSKLVVE
jgi:hypothetical protein